MRFIDRKNLTFIARNAIKTLTYAKISENKMWFDFADSGLLCGSFYRSVAGRRICQFRAA